MNTAHDGLSTEIIDGMLRDVRTVEMMGRGASSHFHGLVSDLCCHVKALATEEEKLRAVANMAHAWMVAEAGSGDEQQAMSHLAETLEHAGYDITVDPDR